MTRRPALLWIAAACVAGTAALAQTPQPSSHTPAHDPANIQRQLARVHAEIAPGRPGAFLPTWDSLAAYRTPDWFRDAKFGIFIHWGVYAVPAFGSEWYSRDMYDPKSKDYAHHLATYGPQTTFGYKEFIPKFKAERFDPDAWVALFAAAGAKYIVPVAEHCDGFAMYASEITPWNAFAMGPHRDVVGELGRAARAQGLHFGVSSHTAEHWWWYGIGRTYPSDVRDETASTALLYGPAAPRRLPGAAGKTNDTDAPDPNHLEAWLPPDKAWIDNWLARSTELVDKYHPEFVYFDWWSGQPAYQHALQEFAAYYYDRSARTGVHPVLTYKDESMPANTGTLDLERGKLDTLRLLPWQTDTSISIESWGYVEHDRYRTAKSLVHQLLDAVAKNGNLLLNVGPKADGTIPEEARDILLAMGAWLRVNGEAVYGSRPFLVFGEGPTSAPKNPTQMHSDEQTYTPRTYVSPPPPMALSSSPRCLASHKTVRSSCTLFSPAIPTCPRRCAPWRCLAPRHRSPFCKGRMACTSRCCRPSAGTRSPRFLGSERFVTQRSDRNRAPLRHDTTQPVAAPTKRLRVAGAARWSNSPATCRHASRCVEALTLFQQRDG